MFLKILSHPVFVNLNFHMPMMVDLSHPLIMLAGENGSGKSTLLHSIFYALRGEEVDGFVYRLDKGQVETPKIFLFDAEQHNPRMHLELFEDNPKMKEFVSMASHGQVMLSMFRETFPSLPNGTCLLLDEPEMALVQRESASHSEDAEGAGGPEEVSHHLRHAFADPDRLARDLRDQPRQPHQSQRACGGPRRRGREHDPVGLDGLIHGD